MHLKHNLALCLILLLGISCENTSLFHEQPQKTVSYMLLPSKHALDPLSETELEQAVQILKEQKLLGDGWYVQELSTAEPEKVDFLYPAYDQNTRRAHAVVLHHARNERYECILDLSQRKLVSQDAIKGQPAVLGIEYAWANKAVKANEEWQKAMLRRNITQFEDVFVDTWSPGDLNGIGAEVDISHRLLRCSFYLKEDSHNSFARPIEGVSAIYDATLGKIVEVVDLGIKPLSSNKRDFLSSIQKESPAPNDCPMNAAFQVSDSQDVSWKNWRFRFKMDPREGLVLYDIGWIEQGRLRPILDRVSLSEMVVPYSDPGKGWYWREAFDEGDYGVGISANPLLRGVHYPVDGQTFDAVFVNNEGKLDKRKNVIAVFERSAGLLWSHWDADAGLMTAKSAKELVISFVFTVGNYDYGVSWVFKENGAIQMQAILTGMLLAKGHQMSRCGRCSILSRSDQFGMLIDDNLIATAHQHFFNFRLDFAVDGPLNSMAEVSLEKASETVHDPYGNVFLINEHQLETEQEAMRNPDASRAKHWLIYNPNHKNRLGHYAGYVLEPGESGAYLGSEESRVSKAAPFLKHALHVTRYYPHEMHAAGDFPSQNEGEGLPIWIQNRNASIQNQDLVVWYTLGVTHLPVVEDWPIMPKHQTSFTLKPMNFFEQAQGM